MPLALAEQRAAQHAFPGKAGLLQGTLLADVRDLGPGFDPVRCGVGEQVARELPLRFGAVTVTPGFGFQPDADYPARRVRPIGPPAPGHEPEGVVAFPGHQRAAVRTEQAFFLPLPPQPPGVLPAVPLVFPADQRVTVQALQEVQVIAGHRAQRHLAIHDWLTYPSRRGRPTESHAKFAVSQEGFGAGRLETGREKRPDTGRVGRGDLGPDRLLVGHQVASRGGQRPAEAVPAAARVDLDGYLPPGGDATADQHEAAVGTPGTYVVAVAHRPGDTRMCDVGLGAKGDTWLAGSGRGDAEHVDDVRLAVGMGAQRLEESRAQRP